MVFLNFVGISLWNNNTTALFEMSFAIMVVYENIIPHKVALS